MSSPLIKARSTVYLLLLYCPLLLTLSKAQTVINVDWDSGDNNMSCLSGEGIACKTLDYALNYVNTSDVIIRIASGTQYIKENVILTGVSDILIEGDQTQVNCTGYNSGIEIIGVSDLVIRGITFSGCGVIHNITIDESVSFQSGVYILNCTDLTLTNITITDTTGIGLVILDTSGTVLIENSHFTNNKVTETDRQHFAGGGGVYIELTKCSPGFGTTCSDSTFNPFAHNSSYTIRDCVFDSNTAVMPPNSTRTFVSDHGPVLQSLGRGGGLSLSLRGESSGNTIEITMCIFTNNKAHAGGGMGMVIDDRASNNTIRITSDGIISDISSNTAVDGGGGVQFGFFNSSETCSNSILFVRLCFENNEAYYGGGMSLYSTRTPFGRSQATENSITFQECSWTENTADVGAAIVLFPEDWTLLTEGYLPKPVFHDCQFNNNYIRFERPVMGFESSNKQYSLINGGIIFSDTSSIALNSTISITDNKGSGIYIISGDVEILPNTFVNISYNVANKGAGMALVSSAVIIANENTTVIFDSNNVSDTGGAIYYSSSDRTLAIVSSKHCFIHYEEILPPDEWKTNFIFINNTATYGSAIYADSLWPCARAGVINGSTANVTNAFHWLSFHFEPDLNSSHIISTAPAKIEMDSYDLLIPPGIASPLDITVRDDLDQEIKTVLLATCDDTRTGDVDSLYRYISDHYKIAFTGNITNEIRATLQTIESPSIAINIYVTLTPCPPGYVTAGEKCECSNNRIPGIVTCNETNGTGHGIMKLGYWAGCIVDTDDNKTKLFTAQCPLGYCDYNETNNGLVTLPSDCDSLSHDESLCSINREGTMCGECTEGTSVYYHSTRFKCEECDSSDRYLGILYYILSELLPLTVLFLVVIIFDISVTSGPVNSFILFAQVMDFFQVTAFGSYNLPGWIKVLTDIYWFFFGFLNLEFFRDDELSFCIWDGTTVLDVLAIKYLTSFYGLLLILILFLVMKYCSCRLLRRYLSRGNSDGRYSIVNGISTFLIITYSQVTKVSFQILTHVKLNGESDSNLANNSRVFLSGETVFFGKDHLPYAIPAIFVMFFAVLLPLFLIGHPLYLKIKQFLLDKRIIQESPTIEESWFSRSLTKLDLCLMPIRDVFQSCFKDNMRFFAGLFFLYRFLISASFAFSTTAVAMYLLLELVVVSMLTVNAIFQPYQRKFYNILDTLIFADLAIINGISLFNFASTQFMISDQEHIGLFAALQIILIYIPIFYVAVFLTLKLLAAKCRCVRFKLRKVNRYIPLFDTRLLDMDQQELVQQEDENIQLLQDDNETSFTSENYPARLFTNEDTKGPLTSSNRLDRNLQDHGSGQYGALTIHSHT